MSRTPAARRRPGKAPAADPAREAWAIVVAMVKGARGKYLAELDLTPAQAHLLVSLDVKRPAQMSELANVLGCDASNVTGIVDRLEARRFISRQPDAEDRRVKNIALTEAGCRVQDRLQEKWFEPPAPVAGLSARDKKLLLEILKRAASADPG